MKEPKIIMDHQKALKVMRQAGLSESQWKHIGKHNPKDLETVGAIEFETSDGKPAVAFRGEHQGEIWLMVSQSKSPYDDARKELREWIEHVTALINTEHWQN